MVRRCVDCGRCVLHARDREGAEADQGNRVAVFQRAFVIGFDHRHPVRCQPLRLGQVGRIRNRVDQFSLYS